MSPAARAAEQVAYLLATHPRARRAGTLWLLTQILGTWSVAAAPPALAASLAGALNWTAITDSHGVPLGAYYLSAVSTGEAITEAAPDLTTNPTSWTRWLGHAITTAVSHQTIVELLAAQMACYVFMIALALWLLRFAMSSTWLYWLATWFRPLLDVIRTLLAELWVFPICLLAGLGVGAHHILWHGRRGHGGGIMLSSFIIGALATVAIRDPLTDLYAEDGMLNQGRNLGFSVAQAAFTNGAIAPGGSQAQLRTLTGLVADATARIPLQLANFGTPIDGIGSCAHAWDTALLTGAPDAPAHAMAGCGAPQALAYAQHLDGANLALGSFYLLLGAVLTLFVCYVVYSYVLVGAAAFLNAVLAVFAAGPAMIHGRPRRRAWRRLTLFAKHAVLVFAYVTYISLAALVVLKMGAPGGYADQVGMSQPVARLVMIALTSAVALGLFCWLKRELGDHTRHDLTHAVSELTRHARDGYDRAQRAADRAQRGYDRGREFFDRNGSQGSHDDSPSGGGPGEPLTGPPAPGRPPAGHPAGPAAPARHRTPSATPTPAETATATPASAGTAAAAAETGAAAVAPELVAGAVIVDHARRRRRPATRQTDNAAPRSTAHTPPHPPGEASPQPPAPGRTAGPGRPSSRPGVDTPPGRREPSPEHTPTAAAEPTQGRTTPPPR